jgi:hypothetical protein
MVRDKKGFAEYFTLIALWAAESVDMGVHRSFGYGHYFPAMAAGLAIGTYVILRFKLCPTLQHRLGFD